MGRFMVPEVTRGASWEDEDGWDVIYLPEGYTPDDAGEETCKTPGDFSGWIGRYTAPGYMDATDWTPLESAEDVRDFVEMYGGEDHFDEDVRAVCEACGIRGEVWLSEVDDASE